MLDVLYSIVPAQPGLHAIAVVVTLAPYRAQIRKKIFFLRKNLFCAWLDVDVVVDVNVDVVVVAGVRTIEACSRIIRWEQE